MGPATVAALQQLLQVLAADPAGILIAATDADTAGRRYAARLAGLATRGRGAVRRDPAARRAERLERRAARAGAGAVTPDRALRLRLIGSSRESKQEEPERKSENEDEMRSAYRIAVCPPQGTGLRPRASARPCPGQPGCGAGGVFQKPMKGRTPR